MFWPTHAHDFLFLDLSTGCGGNHAPRRSDTAKKLPPLPHFPSTSPRTTGRRSPRKLRADDLNLGAAL